MFRPIQWLTPVIAAVALFLAFSPTPAQADDTGSVTGKVVDASGAGVANVPVKLFKPRAKKAKGQGGAAAANGAAQAAGDKPGRPAAIAEATTAADGTFTMSNVAVGEYVVFALAKGLGHGRANVSVAAGAASTPVTITLEVGKAGAGAGAVHQKPATPPAAPPADAK